MKLLTAAAFAAFALAAAPAVAQTDRESEANSAFAEYPKDSLAKGEQGAVRYRVKIDRRGRARNCEITGSSGHQRLDMATCSMLMARARFTPSRNSRGKASGSYYEGRVVWRIG